MNNNQIKSFDENFKWGEIKLEKLPKGIDIERLRKARPILVDEPLFSSLLSTTDTSNSNKPTDQFLLSNINRQSQSNNSKRAANTISAPIKPTNQSIIKNEESSITNVSEPLTTKVDKEIQISLQPTIDSYIINTIKLNRILNSGLTFDQIEFFTNKQPRKSTRQQTKKIINKQSSTKLDYVSTNEEARDILKQFIVVMAIHAGFNKASSIALDILVDLLDDYISSIFKLLKSLRSVHQTDLNSDEPKNSLVVNNFYSNRLFSKQSFEELGIGSIKEIKNFYQNDIISYHNQVYKKVTKLYDEYKARKLKEKLDAENRNKNYLNASNRENDVKTEGELKVEEFMRENDFLNDESNSILGELLTDLNVTHFDEEMNKLLQIIGSDPFSLMSDEFQPNIN